MENKSEREVLTSQAVLIKAGIIIEQGYETFLWLLDCDGVCLQYDGACSTFLLWRRRLIAVRWRRYFSPKSGGAEEKKKQ